ncbi:MAG: hypothetical protein ACXVA9_13115 [Bdellovibrionales bacterium]
MTVPLVIPHAGLVHLPLALAIVIPRLYLIAWISVRKNWLGANIWYVVLFFTTLQLGAIGAGWWSGERAEFLSSAAHDAIKSHEKFAENFFWVWGAILFAMGAMIYFRKSKNAFAFNIGILILFCVQFYLGLKVGHAGGDLVVH